MSAIGFNKFVPFPTGGGNSSALGPYDWDINSTCKNTWTTNKCGLFTTNADWVSLTAYTDLGCAEQILGSYAGFLAVGEI